MKPRPPKSRLPRKLAGLAGIVLAAGLFIASYTLLPAPPATAGINASPNAITLPESPTEKFRRKLPMILTVSGILSLITGTTLIFTNAQNLPPSSRRRQKPAPSPTNLWADDPNDAY